MEQGRDEELDVDFFYSDKVKALNQDEIIVSILNSPPTDHKVLETMTTESLSSSPPELYDPLVVSLKSTRLTFILIECFYLVRIEEIHV